MKIKNGKDLNKSLSKVFVEILIDSSILIAGPQYRLNIFQQLNDLIEGKKEFMTLSTIKKELENLSRKTSVLGLNARRALKAVENLKIIEVEGKNADDSIVEYAEENKCIVCTDDRELKKKLKKIGVKTIIIKGRKKLDFA
jgi:rRNA-processing protein FCF1